jgi:hypothetical protein
MGTSRANMVRWDTCEDDFQVDGSLRDIYITPATPADWRTLYSFLRDYPGVEYSVDGAIHPLPNSVDLIFAIRSLGTPMLRLSVGRALIVFHFFCDNEIECDFGPNQIASQADLDTLLEFIGRLGEVTGKRVVIAPENCHELPFITFDPESRKFEHHKFTPLLREDSSVKH